MEGLLESFGVLATAFILAMFVQFVVGQFKTFITDKYTRLISLIVGIVLCIIYKAGILAMLGLTVQVQNGEYADYILSGIAISGGATGLTEFAKGMLGQIVKARDNR